MQFLRNMSWKLEDDEGREKMGIHYSVRNKQHFHFKDYLEFRIPHWFGYA